MMMNLFAGGASQRIEFVRMKGPQGKGHAEMAVTKLKGHQFLISKLLNNKLYYLIFQKIFKLSSNSDTKTPTFE